MISDAQLIRTAVSPAVGPLGDASSRSTDVNNTKTTRNVGESTGTYNRLKKDLSPSVFLYCCFEVRDTHIGSTILQQF
jgi:hypothetical protein